MPPGTGGGRTLVYVQGSLGVQVGEGNTQIIYAYSRGTWTDGVALPSRRTAPYLATVREIRSWTKQLQDREAYLQNLTRFAQGSEGYRLLEGPKYAGKTALLAELVTARLPPRVDVISFFVSRIMSQADSYKFLAAVVPQLAEILDAPVGEADAVQFRSLWQQAARRALQRDRHLLLVVDGLDEDLPPEEP